MRVFAALLVLLNLGYLVWGGWLGQSEIQAVLVRPPAQQAPGRLVLLEERDDSDSVPGTVVFDGLRAEPTSCLSTGVFLNLSMAESFAALVRQMDYGAVVRKVEVNGAPDYWVHLPPFASEAAARRKLEELRSKNIDSYLITSGDLNLGISLGLFSRQPLALALRERLAGLGYPSEIVEVARTYEEFWVDIKGLPVESEWLALLAHRPGLQRIEKLCETIAPGN